MNTILIETKSAISCLASQRQRAKSALPSALKHQQYPHQQYPHQEASRQYRYQEAAKEDHSTVAGSSNKAGYESLRELTPMKSLSKYFSPKNKTKKYNYLLTE